MSEPVVPDPGAAPTTEPLRNGKRKRSPNDARAVTVDRLPPHSDAAEQGVLGCIFLAPHEVIDICIEKFKVGSKVFYNITNQVIYEELLKMYAAKKAIDEITVMEWLKQHNKVEQVGGLEYVFDLPNKTPSAANVSFYINIVREKYILRKLVTECTDVVACTYEHEGEVDELLDDVERRMLAINMERISTGILSMKEHISVALEKMETAVLTPGAMHGLMTGYREFDGMTLGLAKGDVCIIAARPSIGKTTLAFNIAHNVASRGESVGVISLEMKAHQLVDREISARARVDSRRIRNGELTSEEIQRITTHSARLSALPIHIDDERGINTLQLRSKMRRMVHQYGCRLFVLDYLQLLLSHNKRAENRAQEVASISNAIKTLAGDLDIPIIVLSQLSREHVKLGKGEKPRAPGMQDLRESGAIEQDADEILLLWNPSEREPENILSDEDDWIDVEGILAKQRNGPKGTLPFRFYRRFTLYQDRPKIEADDVPETTRQQWHFSTNT